MSKEDSKVSHDALDAVLDEETAASESAETIESEETTEETTETVGEEVTETEEEKAKREEHEERSRLGRKVSKMEQTQTAFMDEMRGLMVQRQPEVRVDTLDDEPIGLTKGESKADFLRWREEERTKESETKVRYETDYRNSFSELGTEYTDAEHKKITDEMMANFNVVRSMDGAADGRENYLRAENSLLRKGVKSRENPLAKKTPEAALGGAADSATDTSTTPIIKLDKYAQDFVDKTKMSDESIRKALTGETPLSLRGRT